MQNNKHTTNSTNKWLLYNLCFDSFTLTNDSIQQLNHVSVYLIRLLTHLSIALDKHYTNKQTY